MTSDWGCRIGNYIICEQLQNALVDLLHDSLVFEFSRSGVRCNFLCIYTCTSQVSRHWIYPKLRICLFQVSGRMYYRAQDHKYPFHSHLSLYPFLSVEYILQKSTSWSRKTRVTKINRPDNPNTRTKRQLNLAEYQIPARLGKTRIWTKSAA